MQRGLQWPIGMAVVLASTVALNLAVMSIAGDDPSFAVEPDYYAKAVAWDSTAAARAASAALGWSADASVSPVVADGGTLTLRLTAADGSAIDGASVRATAMHVARAASPVELELAPQGDGRYEARVPIARSGLWEVRIAATRADAHWERVLRLETDGG